MFIWFSLSLFVCFSLCRLRFEPAGFWFCSLIYYRASAAAQAMAVQAASTVGSAAASTATAAAGATAAAAATTAVAAAAAGATTTAVTVVSFLSFPHPSYVYRRFFVRVFGLKQTGETNLCYSFYASARCYSYIILVTEKK